MWGEQYVGTVGGLPQVQAEIAGDVAEKLQVRLTPSEHQRLGSRDIQNPEAYELLLKGHFHRAKGGTEDRQKAGEYFTQAIAVDPRFALAYADLSDIYRSLVNSGLLDPTVYMPKARQAAQKALALDDGLADAHYALANLMTYEWEWRDASGSICEPSSGTETLRWHTVGSQVSEIMGRHEQAIREITREGVDQL